MSYGITFKKVPEDVIKEYNVSVGKNDEELLENIKLGLLITCMKKHNENETQQVINNIRFNLKCLIYTRETAAKHSVYEDYTTESEYSPVGEFSLEGSSYRGNTFGSTDNEEMLKSSTESLMKYALLIDTPNFFDESELWDRKYSDISEEIDYVYEQAFVNTLLNIKNELYKYSDEYEYQQEINKNND